ncbi:MAG TPA: SH3 domain-containing protein [Patescibacteria group bacterium]|nr:SH3 domain-containing protein [Patescibacteria group bacterium]
MADKQDRMSERIKNITRGALAFGTAMFVGARVVQGQQNSQIENTMGPQKNSLTTAAVDKDQSHIRRVTPPPTNFDTQFGQLPKRVPEFTVPTDPAAFETSYLQSTLANIDPSQINFGDPTIQDLLAQDASTIMEDNSKIIQTIAATEPKDKVGKFTISLEVGSISGSNLVGGIIHEIHPDNTDTYYVYDSTDGLVIPVSLAPGLKLEMFIRNEASGFQRPVVGVRDPKSGGIWVLTEDPLNQGTSFALEKASDFTSTYGIRDKSGWAQGVVNTSANLRPDSNTNSQPLAVLPEATEVVITGQVTGSDQQPWYQVSVNGKNGFIKADLVKEGSFNANSLRTVFVDNNGIYQFDSNNNLVITKLSAPEANVNTFFNFDAVRSTLNSAELATMNSVMESYPGRNTDQMVKDAQTLGITNITWNKDNLCFQGQDQQGHVLCYFGHTQPTSAENGSWSYAATPIQSSDYKEGVSGLKISFFTAVGSQRNNNSFYFDWNSAYLSQPGTDTLLNGTIQSIKKDTGIDVTGKHIINVNYPGETTSAVLTKNDAQKLGSFDIVLPDTLTAGKQNFGDVILIRSVENPNEGKQDTYPGAADWLFGATAFNIMNAPFAGQVAPITTGTLNEINNSLNKYQAIGNDIYNNYLQASNLPGAIFIIKNISSNSNS